ncbi:dipeptidase [Shewanella avicenniae]|uniref:Dipeptidase n=1 Tax=Shewanella avicenniae TaxID=2814294 RepID=A0ABX7QVR4_9GAMM|nr:dipeptidase [Shewanella avicenniae]QSX35010.1 dipeptidase [Shewanella avicenniae]
MVKQLLLSTLIATSLSATLLPITASANTTKLQVTPLAQRTADYSVAHYAEAMEQTLAQLVSFNTVRVDGLTPDNNPQFVGFKAAVKAKAEALGFDYADHGYVLLVGFGEDKGGGAHKLGIITHGDVQPADPSLWQQSPYLMDTTSEPGKLIGRGTEDDKGPIATALYAMKSIKDQGLPLARRIELMIYMGEESDWEPLKAFLKTYQPGDINVTIDAEYPVVTAEKGWSQISATIPAIPARPDDVAPNRLVQFSGGSFASQIPQQASAVIAEPSAALIAALKAAAATQAQQSNMHYQFTVADGQLLIAADGKSAHSSTPEDGINAVSYLADLLSQQPWPKTQASMTLAFINELVGTGLYAEKFGDIAYQDDFMGPMSLAVTVVKQQAEGTKITLNLRRPVGKTSEMLTAQTAAALTAWQSQHQLSLLDSSSYWGEPMVMRDAPHLQTLLNVFSHFTGIENAKPVAIGGSTNSKLFPNALSFGPAMPGVEYTGHSEHEFITREQLQLNLKMYTAAMVELAVKQ